MSVKQLREDLRFYLALFQLFIALLVFRVVLRLGINLRDEDNILSVRRPNRAFGASRDVRYLTRLC